MYLCAWLERWSDRLLPECAGGVRHVAMPWAGVAAYVSPVNVASRFLTEPLASHGMALACIELVPLTCLDPASFEKQTDDAYVRMQFAAGLGVRTVILASGHAGSVGFDAMRDAVTRLAALAERMELRLLVSNAYGSALEQPDAITVLLRDADSPALGVCLDNLAFHRAAVNPADAAVRFAPRLGAVRLDDERHGLPCRPGAGVGHVAATLEALGDEGYGGPVVVNSEWIDEVRAKFAGLFTSP